MGWAVFLYDIIMYYEGISVERIEFSCYYYSLENFVVNERVNEYVGRKWDVENPHTSIIIIISW